MERERQARPGWSEEMTTETMTMTCAGCGEDVFGNLAETAEAHAEVPCAGCGKEHCAQGTCEPCPECGKAVHALAVFPGGLDLGCYAKTPEGTRMPTADEVVAMWGGPVK